jgi:hypothetical protein
MLTFKPTDARAVANVLRDAPADSYVLTASPKTISLVFLMARRKDLTATDDIQTVPADKYITVVSDFDITPALQQAVEAHNNGIQ